MPTVSFKTIGCRLNQAETARMAAQFEAAGYDVVPFGTPCDVGVIHSCTITARAERKSVRAARSLKRLCPPPRVVMAGCAVEVHRESLREEPAVDVLAGQDEKMQLPALLARNRGTGKEADVAQASCLCPGRTDAPTAERVGAPRPRFETTRALVKVQDGCDFHCAYCIVPHARGNPRSRACSDILDEVGEIADAGYREVVLTGANLGCYRDGRRSLVDLVAAMETIPGIARIRLSSIECTTVEREIVDRMAVSAKLCPYLHLPLQSGDDGVLKAMGRRYTVESYRNVVEYAVGRVPDLGLGTDVLVGLPGEDERAFQNTLGLLRELPFNNLHVFPYSPRPETRAAAFSARVAEPEKRRRAAEAIRLGNEKRSAFAHTSEGRRVAMLVERIDGHGSAIGWTGNYLPARVRGSELEVNRIVTFTVEEVVGDELRGQSGLVMSQSPSGSSGD